MNQVIHTPGLHAPHLPGFLSGRGGRFLWHLAEMVIAMNIGMAIYAGLRALLNPTGFSDVLREHRDVRYLIMAAFMAAAMVLLMRYRGHSWERTVEMTAAMVVPIAVACVLWRFGFGAVIPQLSDGALGTTTHVAMYVGMLLAMGWRFGDYAHAGHHTHVSEAAQAA
jgi:hypothetical protein